jgi:hypothetical protein
LFVIECYGDVFTLNGNNFADVARPVRHGLPHVENTLDAPRWNAARRRRLYAGEAFALAKLAVGADAATARINVL